MIDIKKLSKKDIGSWVIYTDSCGGHQQGRIKHWNDIYVFVVYDCYGRWDKFKDYPGVATIPEDLSFDS